MPDDTFAYPVEPELTIYQAADLKAAWLAAWEAGTRHFDLSRVSDIDGAGLQLLLSLQRLAGREGSALHFIATPPVVREALDQLGGARWPDHDPATPGDRP